MNTKETLGRFRSDPLFSIPPQTECMKAQELARTHGFHHLPIVKDAALVGVTCTCDLLFSLPDEPVEKYMHTPITLSFHHTVEDAIELMYECGVGSIILLDGETPQGIVTRQDLGPPISKTADGVPRCAACGSSSHLREGTDGSLLCRQCAMTPKFRPASEPIHPWGT